MLCQFSGHPFVFQPCWSYFSPRNELKTHHLLLSDDAHLEEVPIQGPAWVGFIMGFLGFSFSSLSFITLLSVSPYLSIILWMNISPSVLPGYSSSESDKLSLASLVSY